MTAIQAAATRAAPPRALLPVLSGNMLLDALEVSAAIVALPSIGHGLHLGLGTVQWVVAGFALGFGGTLLAGGHAVARWGPRRVYLAALLVFAAASVAGALAPSAAVLIGSRVVKGMCVALTAPTGLSIIGQTFPEGAARNRAVAVYSAFGAAGFSSGLLLSGLITGVSWRWTLLFPAPAALALFAAGVRVIPGGGTGGTGIAIAARRLLRRPPLVRSALGAAALNGSFWGLLVTATFRLQAAGWTPLEAGAALLPAALPAALAAPLSGRLVGRWGTSRLIAAGAALPPAGYLLYWQLAPGRPGLLAPYVARELPGLLLVGLGFALCFAALHVQALSGLRPAEHRAATTLYQAAVQLGGVAVLVLVTAHPPPFASLGIVTVVGLLGFLIALTGVIMEARAT
jgi:predicted MFS family arabinose efflux permease